MHVWSWVQHHRWLSVVFLAIIVVGTAGGTAWALFFRTVASPVSLREALRMYRSEQAGPDTAAGAATTGHAVLSPGVFSYATTGGESLNLVGMSRSFPAGTHMVVAPPQSGSCSTVEWVPVVQHTESTTVCPSIDHSLSVAALVSHETIGGSTTTTVITCPDTTYLVPPIAAAGVRWTSLCHQQSPSENVFLHGVVVGGGPVEVQGNAVPTVHVRLAFDFVGPDAGTSPADYWISTGRGLIVRESETAHITQGGVRYTERMDARLTSLTPLG